MAVTPLPVLDRTAPTFKTDTDTFFGTQLPAFSVEVNGVVSSVEATAADANASKVAAAASAAAALASKNLAATSETNALTSKSAASTSATAASGSATAAATSATNALASKNSASTSETNALASKNAAATSATNAGTSEANALASKNAASTSATAAAGSATAAATSATNAATSETSAVASAAAALTSKSAAATSATTAATSATNAGTSETNALASKNAAATSATNAANSAIAAANSAASISSGPVTSVNGKTGVVVLAKADLGLGSVDNTSDVNKPVSTAQAAAIAAVLPALASNAGKVLGVNSTATGVAWVALPEVPPSNMKPAAGATNVFSVSFTGSAFYSSQGKAQASRQARMSLNANFSTLLWDSGEVVGAGATVAGPILEGLVPTSTLVYWQIRYKDVDGAWSAWSTPTSFTTPPQYAPTVAGTAFGGGFYVGRMKIGTDSYALIVAPKASGESASLQEKTTNTTTAGTDSTWDGAANTAAMITAGASAHPAANFCKGLSIGGYTDWALPAKDQLELCYRNLKPDTTANATSFGVNLNSDPVGTNYTAGLPTQTASAEFKTGGAEAFSIAYYWESTEFASTAVGSVGFDAGSRVSAPKSGSRRARAVRMVKI